MNRIKSIYTFISISKDLLIIFLIYFTEFNNIVNEFPSLLITSILILYWVLFNYVLGQYESKFRKLKEKIISNVFNTLIVLISANIIYILINLITDQVNISISDFYIFINIISKIFIYIFISQTLIDIFINKNLIKNNKWLLISNEKIYNMLLDLNSQFNENYKIIRIEKNKFNIKDLRGLIFDENSTLNDKELEFYTKIKNQNLEILNVLKWYEKYLQISPSDLYSFNDILTIESYLDLNNINFRIKRIGDIFLSLFLLLTLLPIIILVIICLLIFQGKPIFYSQLRTGLYGKPIKINKFRTMIINAERCGPQWSFKNDQRVTLIGKILRKYRLDELPQLINVIKGDMSLIGPRPERPEFDKELNRSIRNYNFRYSIKPGLSGWAQVNYHYSSNLNEAINKLNYDIYYIKYQSIYLDFIILFKTLKIIFKARG